jgi:hypothetical protein
MPWLETDVIVVARTGLPSIAQDQRPNKMLAGSSI